MIFRPNRPGGQPNRARKALIAGAAMSVVLGASTYLTRPWEGDVHQAYWDRLGKKWTICFGDTKDVRKGMVKTEGECKHSQLVRMENDYHKPLQRCIRNFDTLPLGMQWAFLDLAWNIGVYKTCHSTAAGRARTKQYEGACHAITWFDKAGHEVVPGLKARRTDGDKQRLGEEEVCLESLKG